MCYGDSMRRSWTPEYKTWQSIKDRTLNPNSNTYYKYGAKGIKMYGPWIDDAQAFIDYMGPRPEGYSIDRIDSNGHYEPGNVRWASVITQAENKTSTTMVSYNGECRSLTAWCRELGIVSDRTARDRVSKGWNPVDAMTTKPQPR